MQPCAKRFPGDYHEHCSTFDQLSDHICAGVEPCRIMQRGLLMIIPSIHFFFTKARWQDKDLRNYLAEEAPLLCHPQLRLFLVSLLTPNCRTPSCPPSTPSPGLADPIFVTQAPSSWRRCGRTFRLYGGSNGVSGHDMPYPSNMKG